MLCRGWKIISYRVLAPLFYKFTSSPSHHKIDMGSIKYVCSLLPAEKNLSSRTLLSFILLSLCISWNPYLSRISLTIILYLKYFWYLQFLRHYLSFTVNGMYNLIKHYHTSMIICFLIFLSYQMIILQGYKQYVVHLSILSSKSNAWHMWNI